MPSKTLAPFRTMLDHLDENSRQDQLLFLRVLAGTGPEAVEEISPRVLRTTASRGLRELALEASYYHPWPEWVSMLDRVLRHESDLELFTTGVQALGRIRTEEALEILRQLSRYRAAQDFQEVLAEVLAHADPGQAFHHHLGRLLEGSANPSVTNEAAQQLGRLLEADSLEPLKTAVMHPDLLIFRHALRLVARITTPEAGEYLMEFLRDCQREVLEDRQLKDLLATLRALPAAEQRPLAQERLDALKAQGEGAADGPLGLFLEVAVHALQGPKAGPFQALCAQAAEEMHLRARRQGFGVDTVAEGLVRLVQKEVLLPEEVRPLLLSAFRDQVGREGLAHALAQLVPGDAQEELDLLLECSDGAQRAAAVEALGERRDPALREALLRACRDPITDVGQRALQHLGALPGAEELASRLLRDRNPDEQRLGIQLAGIHRLKGNAGELLALVQGSTREEIVLEALEALGSVGDSQLAAPLLELLHSGQTPRMQGTLAHTLRDLKDPQTARALCDKAGELRSPLIHAVALEALAAAGPLEPGESARVLAQAKGAWQDRNPWPLRLRVAQNLPELRIEDKALWGELQLMLQEAMAEKRPPDAWSPEDLAQVQAIAKEMGQRTE